MAAEVVWRLMMPAAVNSYVLHRIIPRAVGASRSRSFVFDGVPLPSKTPTPSEHSEVRERALQRGLEKHVKYIPAALLLASTMISFRTGPQLAIPVERVREALAVILLAASLMCADATMKLGITIRNAPAFVLAAMIYGALGHMTVWPRHQSDKISHVTKCHLP